MSVEEKTEEVSTQEFWAFARQIEQLTVETNSLREEIGKLRDVISKLESALGEFPLNIRVIDVKDVPFDEAKNMIYDYYKTRKTEMIYPDEVADELGLDLKVAMRAVEELFEEGKLEEAE